MRRQWSWVERLAGPTWLKLTVTAIALICILARIIWPDVKIDMTTLALIVLAALPWMFSRIESATLPGGWEVKFRDLERAGSRLTGDDPTLSLPTTQHPSYLAVAKHNPSLALAGLVIEIEARVRALLDKHGITDDHARHSLKFAMFALEHRGIITHREFDAIREIAIAAGDAMHGADVEDEVAQWSIDTGPAILAMLDRKIESTEQSPPAYPEGRADAPSGSAEA